MEFYPLDITLISAEGIKDVNMFSKMDVYAVVTILGYPNNKKKTHVDKNCGTNPKWNHRMKFTIDEHSLSNPGISLLIQLKSDRIFRSNKDIGEVNVPIPDLFNGDAGTKDSGEKVVEYQVRTSLGKPKGTLKFSYKFEEKFTQQVEASIRNVDEPMTAYPAHLQHITGTSMAYPPYQGIGYAIPPPDYHNQHPGGYAAAPPPGYGGYPPPGYPQAAPGYGYPPPPGYGYPGPMQQVQPPKKKKGKMGLGMGLGAGLLGGLLVGDMISDVGEAAAYNEGYDDAIGDMDF